MENATKALVIAGAVLISILLISVGIMVFNKSKGSAENIPTDKYVIEQFNSQFTSYFGTNVSGSNVRSLLSEIRTSNVTNETHRIQVNGSDTIPSNNTIVNSRTYVVDGVYGTEGQNNGYIVNITIE